VAFVISDDPEAVSWGEQISRIATCVGHADWEVIPVPVDVSAGHFFRQVLL
jgi:hypothetical protein